MLWIIHIKLVQVVPHLPSSCFDFNLILSPLSQSLLCGPSLSVGSVVPLLERLSDETLWGFSLHLLCTTRRGQYDSSIEKLLDRCPQAIIAYANHQLQDKYMVCTNP